VSDRLDFPASELRRRTVRGAAVTAAFLVGIDGLVLAQGLVVTRLLGPREIGLYGVVSTTVITLIALKRVGIDEAFVAQDEAEQEREFQHAFTLELLLGGLMTAVICALAPAVAALYGDGRLTPLMISLAYLPVAFALQAPLWIFFRRMDYARQRSLQAIQPAVGLLVTVPLAAATSLGVWSIVVGQVAGYVASVGAGLAASPYRLGLRWDAEVARRYLRFSWPILITVLAAMLIAQGQLLAVKLDDSLAAVGFITLAVTLTRYIDRADQIVTATIYPAICALQGRPRALHELFEKSNRATQIWVLPYAVAIVLFAPDLVHFVLGRRWDGAIVLLQGLAVAGAITQVGFNWFSFYRAAGNTRPPALEAVAGAVAFLALAVPGLIIDGFTGFVVGRVLGTLVSLGVRVRYTRRLIPDVRYGALLSPTLVPLALATAAAAAARLVGWGGHRPAGQAVLELVLFAAVYVVGVLLRERPLLDELAGALRGTGALGGGEGGSASTEPLSAAAEGLGAGAAAEAR
jgi:O-antigen/teichoic acid export membrane protein